MGRVTSTIQAPGEAYHFDRHVIHWSWRNQAACAKPVPQQLLQQIDRDVAEEFFPPGASNLGAETRAKQVCHGCPVRSECLADALLGMHPYEIGVRGGMTATERGRLTPQEREVLIAPYATPAPDSEE